MKLENNGAFFMRMKNGNVLYVFYMKTNFMAKNKMLKNHKITYFDHEAKEFKTKSHEPNKIYGVVFENGRDYVMDRDVSYVEFTEMLEEAKELYNVKHYTADKLYEAMHASGVKKMYNKKWFEDKHAFLLKQLEIL